MPATTARSLPLPVFVLGLGTFCLGTSEFMLAGLLPDISADIGVSIPRAGLLITAFAVGMLVGAPVMAVLTLRLPRKATLLGAVVVFSLAHLLPLLSHAYGLLVVSRVVAAVACATFWAVGSVLAVRLSPAGQTAKAMAVIVGGLTLANVAGVPAGSWIGQHFGWPMAFYAVAAASALTLVALVVLLPGEPTAADAAPLRSRLAQEVGAFRQGRLWLALTTTALFQAAVFAAFSYLAPLLTQLAGVAPGQVSLVLLLFGVGSFLGVSIGGRYADRGPLANVLVSLAALIGALVLLASVAHSEPGAIVASFLFGLAGFSIASALNSRVMTLAGAAPTLATSANVSAFNVGNAAGPFFGGLVIDAGLGYVAPVWVAVGLTVLALGTATGSWFVERSDEPPAQLLVPVQVDRRTVRTPDVVCADCP